MPRGGAHFTSQELAQVLSHYDIGIIQRINPLAAGNLRAPKKIIVSDLGKYLLKRRALGKDDRYRVSFSHDVHKWLAKKGFPVSVIMQTRDEKNTILELNKHIYELFEFVFGSRYDGSVESVMDAGRKLGQFHKNLSDFAYRPGSLRGSFHDSSSVRGHLKAICSETCPNNSDKSLRSITKKMMTLYNKATVNVNQLCFDSWDEQIVHGDWHPGNMLFSDRKVVAVLDFDSLKIARSVTDLANGMLQFSIVGGRPNPADWPEYLDQAKLVRFLAGYCEVIKLEQDQLNCLFDLMIETMIAEAVLPIAATGFFGNLSGADFLKMIQRKCEWIDGHREILAEAIYHSLEQ